MLRKHGLKTIQNTKISLSGFADERFILEHLTGCLPPEHFEVRETLVLRTAVEEHDWVEITQPEQEILLNNFSEWSPNCSKNFREFNVSPPARMSSLSPFDEAEVFIGIHESHT